MYNKPMRIALKKIGFIIKHNHPEAHKLAVDLARFVLQKKVGVILARENASVRRDLRNPKGLTLVAKERMPEHADLIVVLGGDGTYLSATRLMRRKSVPLMGVNMGQLGFLTEIKKDEAFEALGELLSGRPATISERSLLEVSLLRNGRVFHHGIATNDAVVSQSTMARIVSMQIAVGGQPISAIRADGVIICTPTGSTAYSLAAGGPILEPSLPAIGITAICPHSLTQRPIVVPDTAEIQISLNEAPTHAVLTVDGQDAVKMNEGDVVRIRRHPKLSLKLISSPSRDYFSLLREKLKFGLRD